MSHSRGRGTTGASGLLPGEREALLAFWRRCNPWPRSWPAPPSDETISWKFEPVSGARDVIVDRFPDGSVAAVITLRSVDNGLAAPPGAIYGSNLLVHERARHSGCSAGLMEAVFRRALACGADRLLAVVDPTNTAALRLYRYYGFHLRAPAVAENPYVELESWWPAVSRWFLRALGPCLPSWPQPDARRLAQAFRPRSHVGRELLTHPPCHGRVELEVEVPAWFRPRIRPTIDRRTGGVVAVGGTLLEAYAQHETDRTVLVVRNTCAHPLGIRIRPTVDLPNGSSPATVAPGDEAHVPLHGWTCEWADGWSVDVNAGDGTHLATLAMSAPSGEHATQVPSELEGGLLQLTVSPRDGTFRIGSAVGAPLVDDLWPETDDLTLAPRSPRLRDVTVWREGAEVACRTEAAGGVHVTRRVRPVPGGFSGEVLVRGEPRSEVRCGWWWRADEAMFELDGAGDAWLFTPHSLPDEVARAAFGPPQLPPVAARRSTGTLRVSSGDVAARLEWSAPDGVCRFEQRLHPEIRVPLAGHASPRAEREVLRWTLTAGAARAVTVRGPSPGRCDELVLDVDEAGVRELRGEAWTWIRRAERPAALRPATWAPEGLVPVVAAGTWRWSLDGGLFPEQWRVTHVQPSTAQGWILRFEPGVGCPEWVEDVTMTLRMRGGRLEVVVDPSLGDESPPAVTVGCGLVVRPPRRSVVGVASARGPVELPADFDCGLVRLLGRREAWVGTSASRLRASGGSRAAVAVWSVEATDGDTRCPLLVTERRLVGDGLEVSAALDLRAGAAG